MQGFLVVAGFVAWLLVAVGVIWAAWSSAAWAAHKLLDRYERLVRLDERRECGNRLITASWWFSEDKPTMDILAVAGQDMLRGSDPLIAIDAEREKWRKVRHFNDTGERIA